MPWGRGPTDRSRGSATGLEAGGDFFPQTVMPCSTVVSSSFHGGTHVFSGCYRLSEAEERIFSWSIDPARLGYPRAWKDGWIIGDHSEQFKEC